MFTIIKDCSPYYVLFTYDGIADYIKELQNIASKAEFVVSNNKSVTAIKEVLPIYDTEEFYITNPEDLKIVIGTNPCVNVLNLDKSATFLTTLPGVRSPIHIDMNGGTNSPVRFRINYPVFINDDKCITHWYSSDGIVTHEKVSYVIDETLSNIRCVEQLHFSQEYAILFNTTLPHMWDNTQSINKRTIIGMRADRDHTDMTFDDAKKNLFGI
jgi:hypothetical protein